eukprot:TRINITY_DN8881_c0_g1_i4.p1 TRINITY_DN8881_c0_g1~~TRINITY_DN8881_c0_g1_i4.p1  ORF type:complete len:575 (+),score=100.50 TRINITY_DN8881_c0_g1_i4:157-1881(+)
MAQDKEFMGHLHHDSWFGGKTIGYFAGVALLINNITGPGVPSLANMFAESGWLVPSIVFIAVWLMSSISTTMYCEAMRKIPGNSHFVGRIEYTSIVEYYFGHKAYLAAQIGLSGALQSLNIISVVQSAQVMDNAISAMFGHSCGLNISPFALSTNGTTLDQATQAWSCIDTNDVSNGNAWGCHVILTMGYLVALVLTLPMGYFNLDDNMIVQVVAFVITFLCWVVWLVGCFFSDSFDHGDAWVIPAIASGHEWNSQAGVIGTVLFNFGFVTTVPSFVNEKKPHVSVNKVVWLSTLICVIVFVVMGVPGAMAFQKSLAGPATGKCELDPSGANCAQSLMDVFTSQDLSPPVLRNNHAANIVMQLSVYLFPIVAVLSSIPVFSIVIKYNMVENGFSHAFSFFWGVVFPWLVALPLLYQPDALNQFITFSSLIFVSFTDFIVPWALYIVLQKQEEKQAYLKHKHSNVQEDTPLLGDIEKGASSLLNIPEHFALPPSWNLTPVFKITVSGRKCSQAVATCTQTVTLILQWEILRQSDKLYCSQSPLTYRIQMSDSRGPRCCHGGCVHCGDCASNPNYS